MSKPGIANLLTVFAERYQALELVMYDMLTLRRIGSATGVQLDQIGAIVGQLRGGLDDDDYRRYVTARIATNRSTGTTADLIRVARLVLGGDAAQVITVTEGPAATSVRVGEIVVDDALANILLAFEQAAKVDGVKLVLLTQPALDDDTLICPVFAQVPGSLSIGATSIAVDSTAGFPSSGTIQIDSGLAVAETATYTGIDSTHFLGVSALVSNHTAGAGIMWTGGPGKGLGDSSDAAVGGQLASARDVTYVG